jgi:beta-aspartyl-peptidase (threonine type)
MKLLNDSLDISANEAIFNVLPIDSGGLIAVNKYGEFSMPFNTPGMFRGIFDSDGNASVGIWEELLHLKLK